MDDALIQDDGVDLIVAELDRCWEVTQDQDKASKIERAFFETHRDVKTETTFMSDVARRKLNLQHLENALGTGLRDITRSETCGKQLRQGGDVDRWQLRIRRCCESSGAVHAAYIFYQPGSG